MKLGFLPHLISINKPTGKKLKKRLEELERRAASSSASPEQKHEELDRSGLPPRDQASRHGSTKDSLDIPRKQHAQSPEFLSSQYHTPPEDGMFSQQFTRQLSTSPPPFNYQSYPSADLVSMSTYAPSNACYALSTPPADFPTYGSYLSPAMQHYGSYLPTMPIKQEYYGDDEISPFSMSYASMAGMDIANHTNPYQDHMAQVSSPRPYPPQAPHLPRVERLPRQVRRKENRG